MSPALAGVLERAHRLGFFGPGPVAGHIEHAAGFVAALTDVEGLVVDLGSGGGVPGFVIAEGRPDLEVVMVESRQRRAAFLAESVAVLGWEERVTIRAERAEHTGRSALRGRAGAVVARGFGAPAVVAECAAPLLRVGGILVVSEPPDDRSRWPVEGLSPLGLEPSTLLELPHRFQVLTQVGACPAAFPREPGRPTKRPLFSTP